MKYLFILIAFFYLSVNGQGLKIKEIKLAPLSKFYNTKEKTIIYPIIITGKRHIDSLINSRVKHDVLSPEDDRQTVNRVLSENVREYGLTNLSYAITYKSSSLLSLNIYFEGCGAYCSSNTLYFNFDLKTGYKLELKDLLQNEKIDSFTRTVQAEKTDALKKYLINERSVYLVDSIIDSITYDKIVEQVSNECMRSVNLDEFAISSNSLEIFDLCEFPHFMRSQEPTYELKYSYQYLSTFLNEKYKKLLLE